MVRYFCTRMKRILAITLLFTLLLNYTGLDLCVDYCCDKIESIHLGFTEEDECHLGDCQESSSACCDSETVHIAPSHFDYTGVSIFKVKANSSVAVLQPLVKIESKNQIKPIWKQALKLTYPPPQDVLDRTQVSLC